MKVGISYGFAEGPAQAKKLIRLLKENGFNTTKRLERADIIIAHSGGCYLLPEKGKAEVVMLVGFPFWTDKNPRKGLAEKLAQEIKDLSWLRKTFFNTIYFFAWPQRWYHMYKAWQKVTLPQTSNYGSIISVRNEHDPFMHPIESEALATERGWKLHKLSGGHDDLWTNPQPYVDILLKNLKNI